MIIFNYGKTIDARPYFGGTVCTIYTDSEPNTSGFSEGGMDFSDFKTLYRQGDGFYQLSNDGRVCEDESEEVPTKEFIDNLFKEIDNANALNEIEEQIKVAEDELASTDYIMIKAMEGLDMSEYDMEAIKADRQELRDKINRLRRKRSLLAKNSEQTAEKVPV